MAEIPKEYDLQDLRKAKELGDPGAEPRFRDHLWRQRITDAENLLQPLQMERDFLLKKHLQHVRYARYRRPILHPYIECEQCAQIGALTNAINNTRAKIKRYELAGKNNKLKSVKEKVNEKDVLKTLQAKKAISEMYERLNNKK